MRFLLRFLLRFPAPLAAVALASLLAGCVVDESPPDGWTPGPGWQESKPEGFSYVLLRACECLPEYSGPFSVRATSDSVVAVYRLLGNGDSVQVTALIFATGFSGRLC